MYPISHLLYHVSCHSVFCLLSHVSCPYQTPLVSQLLSPASHLLSHVYCLSHVSCLHHVSCLYHVYLSHVSVLCLKSTVCLSHVSWLTSIACLTSLCLSHVSSLSHVDCLSHVSCLSHISCHTSPSQEGWDWPAAAYQWDATKLCRLDFYRYWYIFSEFRDLVKSISGFRQFSCFNALSGLNR